MSNMSVSDHFRDADIIDTRDLVESLNELDADNAEEAEDAAAIRALFEELSGYGGDRPEDGITLIRDDYFERYAQDLADDLGMINADAGWPMNYIDWEAASNALRMDYTSVEIDGVTYWYR